MYFIEYNIKLKCVFSEIEINVVYNVFEKIILEDY